ncbi:MAG TPA: pre-peptidase C-terminal domain-containing protein, partial [Pirellulaceae bacterium]|nr:pre-peptidase C-terminal domain-containing protein [Pirellulaceae bacterium]
MRVHLATSLFGALLTAFLAVPALAQPTVTSLSPAAVPPGKTVEVTLVGTKLDDPLSIWTSFPAKVEPVPPAEAKPGQTKRVVKITADATAGVGVGGLVVATAEGATDVLFVMVDDLPSTADNGANQAFAQAQALTLPTAVDGVSDGPRFDYYKFDVQAGQRVAVEAVAGRLAQDFDPVIRLLDATGKELLLADDDAALGSDCRFAHTFQAAGQYVVEIRDNQYRGGGKYRLRVGDFPLVSTAYPLGVQAGVAAKVGFAGPTSEAVPQVDVNAPPTAAGGRISIGGKM